MDQGDKISVLIVDDRQEKLLALEAVLTDLPLELVRATSGREALRQLLQREFALILLDIDMPGLDGFETATLIRQRRNCQHTPIIFVTAYQDDVLMARGYSLGAVDYILQPVVPEVLKSKVAVFVDLYRKTELVRKQAQWQAQRAAQLQKLAAAALDINAAPVMDQALQAITDAARDVLGSHQAVTLFVREGDHTARNQVEVCTSFADSLAEWRHQKTDLAKCMNSAVARGRRPTRMSEEEVRLHPDWELLKDLNLPPIRDMIAVPLIGKGGSGGGGAGGGQHMGVIYLSDKPGSPFNEDDEAILVQLAQMGVVAIENILNAEARQANRAKDQFIAVLSHELRTPLTPALATLSLLVQDGRLPDDIRDDLTLVHRNVELEARLIDDLLDLTRIIRGKIEMHMVPVDAHDILRRALGICQPDILAKDLQVTLRLAAEKYFVKADPTRLQQVFWNLIKNAVKFTPPNGRIQINSSNGRDGHIVITIEDTGIGIDAEVLPKIFTAFEQGKSTITRQFGGLGLGLAISKALIEPHNGILTAHSDGSGHGALFTLALPLTRESPVASEESARADGGNPAMRALRVLMVEDHRDTARVMTRLLRSESLKVEWAPTIAEAMHLASESHFDIVVSDIGLPDGSGLDLMRQLRARQSIQGIALSGFGMEEDIRRSRDAGFAVHLTKPVNFKNLIERIRELSVQTVRSPATRM
jgi:signal transduction histidine kinase/DNA-binding response OmpR family regulator